MKQLAVQIVSFGIIGVIGFGVDSAVLYALIFGAGVDHMLARLPSFLAAATCTWALNRRFTFRGVHHGRRRDQWAKFLAANSLGACANLATYSLLIGQGEPFLRHPVLAVGAGSLAGMGFNFIASKWMVFRQSGRTAPVTTTPVRR